MKKRRILVIAGGGAKGAYAFGCLLAFRHEGIEFDAVAGTSAGALNALVWSTDNLEEGKKLWSNLSFDSVYPLRLSLLKKLPKKVITALGAIYLCLRLIWATVHGTPTPHRVVWLILAWLFLFPIALLVLCPPTALAIVFAPATYFEFLLGAEAFGLLLSLGKDIISVNEFPTMLKVLAWFGYTFVFGMFTINPFILFPTMFFLAIGVDILGDLLDSLCKRAIFPDDSSFLKSLPLQGRIDKFLEPRDSKQSFIVPLVVATAKAQDIYDPERARWFHPNKIPIIVEGRVVSWMDLPGGEIPITARYWVPNYWSVDQLARTSAAKILLASAALPYGIVPPVQIEKLTLVDGGVVDNCPIHPFLNDASIQELCVVLLDPVRPGAVLKTLRSIGADEALWQKRERLRMLSRIPLPKTIPKSKPAPKTINPPSLSYIPTIFLFAPDETEGGLGGFLSGTLNFDPKYARRLMCRGYRETMATLRGNLIPANDALQPKRSNRWLLSLKNYLRSHRGRSTD